MSVLFEDSLVTLKSGQAYQHTRVKCYNLVNKTSLVHNIFSIFRRFYL